MKEKLKFQSKKIISVEDDSKELLDIVQKRGIKIPSVHLGFFKTIYAKIEEPNLNGIRLAKKAVEDGITGLVGSQVNFEHLGAGFVMGNILDAWINDNEEIEVVYSMFKSIYPDEYERSVEQAKEGELSVSFELLSERNSQEYLDDGTIRLNDIDFIGMGHLMDNPPAYPGAKVKEFAIQCKKRLSNVEDRELVCASVIEKACDEVLAKEQIKADKWTSDIYNNFPDSSFAVIEPAFLNGETGDNKARHLAFKDRDGKVDLTNYRIALDKVDEILPITDSITTEELRKQAKEELDKHKDVLKTASQKKKESDQGGNTKVELTEEQKTKIEELRSELGDIAKDVKDEDLLDEAKVEELRKAKKEEIALKVDTVEVRTFSLEDNDGIETIVENVERITKTDFNAMQEALAKVAELESTLEAKDSEIESVRENAEKIGKTKIQLKDNEFTKDFTDEDYLDDEKVEKAIQDQKNTETIAQRKEELKDNEYAKDFTDEDYLNDDKIELAKVKKEKDEIEKLKDKKTATKEDEEEEDMSTGEANDKETDYDKVIADVRKQKTKTYTSQIIYEKE
jgi:hypothetical protein